MKSREVPKFGPEEEMPVEGLAAESTEEAPEIGKVLEGPWEKPEEEAGAETETQEDGQKEQGPADSIETLRGEAIEAATSLEDEWRDVPKYVDFSVGGTWKSKPSYSFESASEYQKCPACAGTGGRVVVNLLLFRFGIGKCRGCGGTGRIKTAHAVKAG